MYNHILPSFLHAKRPDKEDVRAPTARAGGEGGRREGRRVSEPSSATFPDAVSSPPSLTAAVPLDLLAGRGGVLLSARECIKSIFIVGNES